MKSYNKTMKVHLVLFFYVLGINHSIRFFSVIFERKHFWNKNWIYLGLGWDGNSIKQLEMCWKVFNFSLVSYRIRKLHIKL